MRTERILVVEDDDLNRELVTETIESLGLEVLTAKNGREAIGLLKEQPDAVLTDLRMPEIDGIDLVRWIRQHTPSTPVVMMTAFATLEVAIEALREGVEDLLLKPLDPEQITLMIKRLDCRGQLLAENRYLRDELSLGVSGHEILGDSEAIQRVLAEVHRVAPSKATVFIRGESGTGKELVARAIHKLSPRHDQPFIRVNCAALSESLLESELFGHEKGAFTGAMQRREGRFELAHKGTLLLDEVSEVSPRIQAKLLRVLEEEEFERVGGSRTLAVDVRIIATSNRELEKEVAEGGFREDLFYRLHVVPIQLPALRHRISDVPILMHTFVRRFAAENGRPLPRLSSAAMDRLLEYPWPGNVRELSNFAQRLVVLSQDPVIDVEELNLPNPAGRQKPRPVEELIGMSIEQVERELILGTLRSVGGHRTRAAELLGVTTRTISNKLREYRRLGLEIPEKRPPMRMPVVSGAVLGEAAS